MADVSKIVLPNQEEYDIKDSTARSSIPTAVSQLTNDSGYITSVPDASTSVKGIVQLSSSTSSTSTSLAATASAVKAAYDHYPPSASTSTAGIVQLSDSVSSTSTSLAATANAVRSAYNHGGVTSVNGSTGAVTLSIPATPNIYVTAHGTSGEWTYRKWSDKTYECWKTKSFSTTVASAWGSTYYTNVAAQSYPVTFTSLPYEVATLNDGTKTLFLANNDVRQTKSSTSGYLVMRPTNAGVTITYNITYYVRGNVSS